MSNLKPSSKPSPNTNLTGTCRQLQHGAGRPGCDQRLRHRQAAVQPHRPGAPAPARTTPAPMPHRTHPAPRTPRTPHPAPTPHPQRHPHHLIDPSLSCLLVNTLTEPRGTPDLPLPSHLLGLVTTHSYSQSLYGTPGLLLSFHCAFGEGNNSLTDGFAVAYALKVRRKL